MKILFIGLGSIGIRHFRNLVSILEEDGISFTVDAVRTRNNPLPEDISSRLGFSYSSYAELQEFYDLAFICNPTYLHFDTIRSVSPFAGNLFIEKPVFDRTDYDLNELVPLSKGIQYVACPLRYTGVLQRLKEIVSARKVFAARAICSTYLPNWRPRIDYRDTYSAHKDQGGGVSIDLIHEWDYLAWLFGFPDEVCNFRGKYSDLEIDSDDHSIYIAKYPDKQISLSLDYFGRIERREIELYLEDEVVVGDIFNKKVHFIKNNKTLDFSEPRDTYQKRELRHFFAMMNHVCLNDNTIEQALEILKLAKGKIHGPNWMP